jgi:hypothetical protein
MSKERYVVFQTGFETDSTSLLRKTLITLTDALISEVERYDADTGIYINVDCGLKFDFDKFGVGYRKGLKKVKSIIDDYSFSSIRDVYSFLDKFELNRNGDDFILTRSIQRESCSIDRRFDAFVRNVYNDEDIYCVSKYTGSDTAETDFLEKFQNTVTFKDGKANVMLFWLIRQYKPDENSKWKFGTIITDANWYIQELGLRKGYMRSNECDYELWYRDKNYGLFDDLEGGIGLVHGDD